MSWHHVSDFAVRKNLGHVFVMDAILHVRYVVEDEDVDEDRDE
ncbi:hypothetical protein N9980_00040 [bacterium]|nr:hypothetical protein [bacterium]